jgi:hypothetical protein
MIGCLDCESLEELDSFLKTDVESILHENRIDFNRFLRKQGLVQLKIDIGKNANPKVQLIRQQLSRVFAVFFARAKNKAANAVEEETKKLGKKLTNKEKLAALAFIAIQWQELLDGVYLDLLAAAQLGIEEGLTQLGITDDVDKADLLQQAETYAKERSAEMIGLEYVGNNLLENPVANFVISETTKDDLIDVVDRAVEEELTLEQLQTMIRTAATFSDLRATLIANNEVALAQVNLHLKTWRKFGVKNVNVELSSLHSVVDECDEIVAGGPYAISNVPIIPAHPNCMCTIVGVEE